MQKYYTLSSIAILNGMHQATVTAVAARADIRPDGVLSTGLIIFGEGKAVAISEMAREYQAGRKRRTVKPRTPKK